MVENQQVRQTKSPASSLQQTDELECPESTVKKVAMLPTVTVDSNAPATNTSQLGLPSPMTAQPGAPWPML